MWQIMSERKFIISYSSWVRMVDIQDFQIGMEHLVRLKFSYLTKLNTLVQLHFESHMTVSRSVIIGVSSRYSLTYV